VFAFTEAVFAGGQVIAGVRQDRLFQRESCIRLPRRDPLIPFRPVVRQLRDVAWLRQAGSLLRPPLPRPRLPAWPAASTSPAPDRRYRSSPDTRLPVPSLSLASTLRNLFLTRRKPCPASSRLPPKANGRATRRNTGRDFVWKVCHFSCRLLYFLDSPPTLTASRGSRWSAPRSLRGSRGVGR
jgi:hypothetical protein